MKKPPSDQESEMLHIPVVDEQDQLIVLIRDIHFSGSFSAMLTYYEDEEKKGIHPDVPYERILYLAEIERNSKKNIAPEILSGAAAELVYRAKKMYQDIEEAMAPHIDASGDLLESAPVHIVLLDCVISEEPIPLLARKYSGRFSEAKNLLHTLISSDALYDHLSPGYGTAPFFAMACVRELKDETAAELLFDRLYDASRPANSQVDDEILMTLQALGAPVRDRMMARVRKRPMDRNREKAIHVLFEFLPDPEISALAADELNRGDSVSQEEARYLALLANPLVDM